VINLLALLPQTCQLSRDLSAISDRDATIHMCASFGEILQRLNNASKTDSTFVLIDETVFDLQCFSLNDINVPFTLVYRGKWLQVLQKYGASEFFSGIWGESKTGGVMRRNMGVLQILLHASCQKKLPLFLDFFASQDVNIVEKTLKNVEDKRRILGEIEEFVVALGGEANSQRYLQYARKASEAVDELLLNAVWDANPALLSAKRDANFVLSPVEEVKVRWAFDGDLFGYSVSDPFGRLERASIVRHLTAGDTELGEFLERKSGGLGIKRVFERSHHMVAAVRRDVLTEIQCFMRFEKRLRDFQAIPKSLHYFVEGDVRP